ncbi:PucR family transcriptional regulator [Indiicoccus explosivorum]|uniref:PucR family transcriptional regulator n=1 Tax=Indiicoccus explosivorum TaxID=1917864 RepID=UPI000B449030|nr:helix-turn-helix domain-containing protein [Indiicoccus explosivorum]
MIDRLRKIYPSLLLYGEDIDTLDSDYKWFSDEENTRVLGIHESELAPKDIALLSAFLLPHNAKFPLPTKEEKQWQQAIRSAETPPGSENRISAPFRFTYFSFNKNQITPVFFKAALQELFEKQILILWDSETEGILVEKKEAADDGVSYGQIVDLLMSDLYVKIRFFSGPFRQSTEAVHAYYRTVKNTAVKVFAHSDKAAMTYADAVPHLMVAAASKELRQEIGQTVLQEYISDRETLEMIEVLVRCNLNISESAKELHLHRNSLQYRLDRFSEKTGIDIRQFHQAMAVYLALLAKRQGGQQHPPGNLHEDGG